MKIKTIFTLKSKGLYLSFGMFLLTFIPIAKSQSLPYNEKGRIEYSDVVYLDSTFTKDQIYSVAREWFALRFKNSNYVIQMDDENHGKIIGKGVFEGFLRHFDPPTYYIEFTISLYIKESRYKYVITDFSHTSALSQFDGGALEAAKPNNGGFFGINDKSWTDIKMKTNEYVINTINDLNHFIKENSIKSEDAEW